MTINTNRNGVWFAYIATFLTPFTLMISGIIAIIYSAYQMNKGTDDVTYSHYYTIIKTFFLFFTFFVVLGVTAATTSGMVAGAEYWVHSSILDMIRHAIPYIGAGISFAAICFWFVKISKGMMRLKADEAVEI
ncbi:hypothetical protein A3K86_01930 [Photobacterium jeanii]|uniref:MotA/TolQ/ExbB proton channel domain-containing protein n=1 Tax=Photobacterium jeanii TaxID=858640 RepID=A0A178KMB4_9GAMM|nr:hypothetical protein [Photobacterium jeanii]OAN17702.1 hypothetical protein A3K86_01930 [Photobacterium jeanii]PST92639.1 hypothetical protein C9I91_05555 [Photobacterium jeanii]